jgi:hypothetical protein
MYSSISRGKIALPEDKMENTHRLRPFGLEINDLECGGW